jgi:hypothetical protein
MRTFRFPSSQFLIHISVAWVTSALGVCKSPQMRRNCNHVDYNDDASDVKEGSDYRMSSDDKVINHRKGLFNYETNNVGTHLVFLFCFSRNPQTVVLSVLEYRDFTAASTFFFENDNALISDSRIISRSNPSSIIAPTTRSASKAKGIDDLCPLKGTPHLRYRQPPRHSRLYLTTQSPA